MGLPAEKRARATLADLEAVPPNMIGELINGTLYIFSRPAPPSPRAAAGKGLQEGLPCRQDAHKKISKGPRP